MTIRLSTALRNYVLDEGSFKDALQYGWLHIFSGSQPSDADEAETGDLMMEISEQMSATFATSTTFTVSGDQTAIFAAGRTLRVNVGAAATFGTSSTLKVSGDVTTTFSEDKSFKAHCGADGVKTVTVDSASFDGEDTLITTNESTLTSNLTGITWLETVTVDESVYSDPDTTVTINESVLTDDLTTVCYGIRLGDATSGYIQKMADTNLKGEGKRTGNGGCFRFYANALDTGGGTDAVCMDGSFGSTGDLKAVSSSIQGGAESSVSTLKLSLPV